MTLRLARYFAAAVLLAAALALHADEVVEEIVARINNDVITRTEFDRNQRQLEQEARQANASAQQLEEQKKDLLRDMIDQQLLVQHGRDLGITADAELIKRLDEIRKNAGLSSLEELEQAAQQQGVNYEDWKQNLRNQIVTREVIAREVSSKLTVGPDELQQFYDQHKQRFAQPETVRLSEILVPTEQPAPDSTPDNPKTIPMGDADLAQQKATAERALALIRSGTPFEEVAKQASSGPTAQRGGDIGEFKRGVLSKELEELAFDKMKPGDVSDVIRTRQGWIILKVAEHKQSGVPAYKDVQRQVEEMVYYQKLQPALRAFLTRLREQSYVVVKEGYVDSGASPNQTVPLVSTAPMPGDKKQKEESRRFYCLWLCKS